MTGIFHTEDIVKNLQKELSSTSNDLTIISAFTKLEALKFINSHVADNVKERRLLVRFQLSDILGGSTDFEIYDYCKLHGWRIFINLDLHSKIFIFDSRRFMIGSANVTLSGIGLNKHSNIESMVSGELTNEELLKINSLFDQSIELDDQLIEKLTTDLVRAQSFKEIHGDVPNLEWDKKTLECLKTDITLLWTTDFFFDSSPFQLNSHDLDLLEMDGSLIHRVELLRARFKKAKCYKWIECILMEKEEIYFGELTALLHDALIDDPRPYRKDVKILVANLLNWIVELGIGDFIIDRPNYSQRIRWSAAHSLV